MARPADEEVYCDFDGSSFENWRFLQVDHFKPRSFGGSDELGNLVTACASCNNMKAASDWPTIEVARSHIREYLERMRKIWEDSGVTCLAQNPGSTRISVVLGSIARDKATRGDLLSVMG